jgi:pyrimidine-specific ribonucleoside hydrolase
LEKIRYFLVIICILFFTAPSCSNISHSQLPSETPLFTTSIEASSISSTPTSQMDPFVSPQDERMPVIFSHGGGPCDIGALVFLSKNPSVKLIGLVLSFGEIHPANALDKWSTFLYDVLDYDSVTLGLGSETPLDPNGHSFPSEWRALADNFWGLQLPGNSTRAHPMEGYKLIVNLINASPKKVTLLVMGAQTDLALAIRDDPAIVDNIANIVIMGGAFNVSGNLSEGPEYTDNIAAEWNMYVDPLAADTVMRSGAPISIIPLDAVQYLVRSTDMDTIKDINDPGVSFVAQMWAEQWGWSDARGFLIWDTITATAVTNPENFTWIVDGVEVITEPGNTQGQTLPLNNNDRTIRYAVGANYASIMELIFTVFRGETDAIKNNIKITDLAGTWKGDTGAFHIRFTLNPLCMLMQPCGTFEIPEFSMTGDVTIVNIDKDIYEFKVSNVSTGQGGNEYEYLQVLGTDSLKYHTEGGGTINEAILYHP